MNRKIRRRKKRIRLLSISFLIILSVAAAYVAVNRTGKNDKTPSDAIDASKDSDIVTSNPNEPANPKPAEKEDIEINIKATGDIMFHPSQIDGAYDPKTDSYDFYNSFRAVKNIFKYADLSMANFEGTTAGNSVYAYQGYPLFNAPDEVLDAIKDAGFDVLSTANNHSLDTRKAGVIRTIEQINLRGMDTVGTYKEKPETRVLIKDVKGIKIAILSYTDMVNGLESVLSPKDLDEMINITDETKMKEDIAYAKEQNADVIIAYMHWGNEYARSQSKSQEITADMLFNEGVDIILGSHPHVIQPARRFETDGKTKYVAYSMGNFLSNQRIETLLPYGISEEISKYTEDGVIVDIEIVKSGKTGEISIKSIKYIPLWVYKGTTADGRVEHVVYPIMEYIEDENLNNDSKIRMQRSFNDTTAQMEID